MFPPTPGARCAPLFWLLLTSCAWSTSYGDMILDQGTFSFSAPGDGPHLVATTQFNLTSADIPNVTFESNYDFVDAGVAIVVNNTTLFDTGVDVSNFGPQVFQATAVQPNNIDFSFSPNNNGIPRLTVLSNATGTSFSGSPFTNSTTVENYIPLFSVADFSSLLQAGNNTVEIFNLNNFQGANLDGDFTVTLQMDTTNSTSIPEPSSATLCFLGSVFLLRRRRTHSG